MLWSPDVATKTMDVAVRRKKLAEIRAALNGQTEEDPFSLSRKLTTGETVSDYVVSVALNIHKKRTTKSKASQSYEGTISTVGGMDSIRA